MATGLKSNFELYVSEDPAKVVCIDSKRVCDGVAHCPKSADEEISFDEANCGCPQIKNTPVEILISLDMSIESYNTKPRGKAPKTYKDFAKKLIERFSITPKGTSPHVGIIMYGDKTKSRIIHYSGSYGFLAQKTHSKKKVLKKLKALKFPKPRNGFKWAYPWEAADKASRLFRTKGAKKILIQAWLKMSSLTVHKITGTGIE